MAATFFNHTVPGNAEPALAFIGIAIEPSTASPSLGNQYHAPAAAAQNGGRHG